MADRNHDHEQFEQSPHGGHGCGEHCPFLNRADRRCSKNFSLDHLQHAFEYCFGQYNACGVYEELLTERLVRRGAVPAGAWDVWPADPGHATAAGAAASPARAPHASSTKTPVVQLTIKIPHRYAKPVAAASYVPAAPRF